MWPAGVVVMVLDLRVNGCRSAVAGLTPGLALSGNNLGQVVRTCVPLSPGSII